jgi:transposase
MRGSEPVAVGGGFEGLGFFAGFDWAQGKHDVAVVDPGGQVVLQLSFAHDAEGWAQLREKLAKLGGPVGVAIETSCGPEVERLLEMGLAVYPMNPKAAERYRERKAPSGVKNDGLDAYCFANALRTDGRAWRRLRSQDPATQLLRILCRDEIGLIEQRTALVLQLKAALREYYPAALEAFEDWTAAFTWDFVVQFPTPQELARAGRRRQQKFLHTHRLYQPELAEKRLAVFARANAFASPSPAVTSGKSLLATTVAKTLRVLEGQIQEYRRRIAQAFADHPDHGIFASLPRGGQHLAPRLLAEMGSDRQVFASAEALHCYSGVAPVTRQSGKWLKVTHMRRACNKTLRTTLHLFADVSRQGCVWAEAYYQHKRQEGHSHAHALRCLGQRWEKILWKMWQDHKPYDEALHTRNQVKHGSWVVALTAAPPPAPTR